MRTRVSFAFLATLLCAASLRSQSLDGFWRTQGYGEIYEIQGSEVRVFEVTATTCVPGPTAQRDPVALADREATFKTPNGGVFFIRTGGSADHKVLHNEGSASDIRLDRLPQMPALCSHPTPNTPIANFEVFSRTWAEHYISFDQQKTDWNQIVETSRGKVKPGTTPAELFGIFEAMIQPFNDVHTSIRAPDLKRRFRALRPGSDGVFKGHPKEPRADVIKNLWGITDRAYLPGGLKRWCQDQIQYGHFDTGTGYLRILSFSDYAENGDFASGLAALESALDQVFADPDLKALVIDLRVNAGGADPYGLAIAARLATREYLAYTKEARAHPTDRSKWTPGDPSIVRPTSRPGFRGPAVLLTGPLTISAGETFTQALMGRTPHVTRVGESTQGGFSDVLLKHLPNGWTFGLPNEVFRTPQGTTFDLIGIPPDVAVPVFADEDVTAGRDPAMAMALEILRKK